MSRITISHATLKEVFRKWGEAYVNDNDRDEWGPLPATSGDLEEYAENSRQAFLKFLMEIEDD